MMKRKIALLGAGYIGSVAYHYLKNNDKIVCYVDNDPLKYQQRLNDVPIISFEEFLDQSDIYPFITCLGQGIDQFQKQLKEHGITKYDVFDASVLQSREKLLSFSNPSGREDVILYHVLHDMEHIFYIDVGSNSPILNSVTKLFYDKGIGRGINIEPLRELVDFTKRERPEDINLCYAVGARREKRDLYVQGELSTLVSTNQTGEAKEKREVEVVSLTEICEKYVKEEITFLKIDVEGSEKAVLEGADFQKYRPWIIVAEATRPGTDEVCFSEWEDILLRNDYHYVTTYGANRYYVANEKEELDVKFPVDFGMLNTKYEIFEIKQTAIL